MALRIRKDRKTIECAAKSIPKEDDVYLDDQLQYVLSVEMNVIYPTNRNTDKERWHFTDRVTGKNILNEFIKDTIEIEKLTMLNSKLTRTIK